MGPGTQVSVLRLRSDLSSNERDCPLVSIIVNLSFTDSRNCAMKKQKYISIYILHFFRKSCRFASIPQSHFWRRKYPPQSNEGGPNKVSSQVSKWKGCWDRSVDTLAELDRPDNTRNTSIQGGNHTNFLFGLNHF